MALSFFDLTNKDNIGFKFLLKIQPFIIDVNKSMVGNIIPKNTISTDCSGMWAIINKEILLEHITAGSHLSSAYYVKAPMKNCATAILK